MNSLKRNLSLFSLLLLLSISPLKPKARAQADANMDDQPNIGADQDDMRRAEAQPRDEYDQAPSDDQYGANHEQEAEGQTPPPPSASAPQPAPSENTPDAPARAARLQFMRGSISIQPRGTGDWAKGELNRPLTDADNIWADKDSRAELSVGAGIIRIDSESSLTLTNVDQNNVQLQLHQGAMNLHVRRLYDSEVYEVDTPNQAFTISKPGDYRFDVDPERDTTVVTVWRGEGESTGNGPSVRIHQNEQARFTGTSMENQVHAAPRLDGFDQWAQSRDERMERSKSARYVSPDVPGYEDLDEYGEWRESPDYGSVWVPTRVAVGWAPYRYGHWIWISPWGWTWVEDEPWGYAPFHYGRWVYWGGAWGWAPGPVYVRPYYAPALVAWFGGPRWGVSVGFGGGYGWCPLGFGEAYVPWYHVSRGYFNRVNITNTRITNVHITNVYNNTYVHNTTYVHNGGGSPGRPPGGGGGPYGPHSAVSNIRYANMRAPNGFTAVSRNTLTSGQSVARNTLRVSPNEMGRITPVHAIDARPSRTAVMGGTRASVAPPSRSFARPTVARNNVSNIGRPQGGLGNTGGFGRPASPLSNARPSMPSGNARPESAAARPGAPANNNGRGSMMSRSIPQAGDAGRPSVENRPTTNAPRSPDMSNRGGMPQTRPDFGSRSADRPPAMTPRGNMNVPRPPSAMSGGNRASVDRGGFDRGDASPAGRPYGGGNNRPMPNYGGPVNRPTPSYDRAPQERPTPNYGGGYNRPTTNTGGSMNRPTPSYGRAPQERSMPNYGGGNYGRPAPSMRPAPSYGGGPSARSMPPYGGGRPTPSYGGDGRSMPSYGGGGRAPSMGGGMGGERPTGPAGGRPSGGGGGGHAPSGGGGGHTGGGGGHSGRH